MNGRSTVSCTGSDGVADAAIATVVVAAASVTTTETMYTPDSPHACAPIAPVNGGGVAVTKVGISEGSGDNRLSIDDNRLVWAADLRDDRRLIDFHHRRCGDLDPSRFVAGSAHRFTHGEGAGAVSGS